MTGVPGGVGAHASRSRSSSSAVWVSAVAPLVALVSTVFGATVATGASTSQKAAFVLSGVSILIGIAAGVLGALLTAGGLRKRRLRWTVANLLMGLFCVALELLAGVDNMQ